MDKKKEKEKERTKVKFSDARNKYLELINVPQKIQLGLDTYPFLISYSSLLSYNLINLDKNKLSIKPMFFTQGNVNIANIIYNRNECYFIVGDIPISADGEYRHGLCNFREMEFTQRKQENANIFQVADKFYKKHKHLILTPINARETIFVIAHILSDIYGKKNMGYPHNYNRAVYNIFYKYIEKITVNNLYPIRFYDNVYLMRGVGTKIIPLYLHDMKLFTDNDNYVQKEIMINYMIRRLIVNGICMHYSTIVDWSIFKINDLDIFNNRDIIRKYMQSEQYVDSLVHLYRAGQIDGDEELIKTYRRKIMVPVKYAEKNLILSEYCLFTIMDYTGITVANLILENITNPHKYVNHNICISLENCRNAIFQIIYALLAMNRHFGLIHGDLHLNNITLRKYEIVKNSIYYIDQQIYLHDFTGIYSVIDFGRSFINPEKLINETYSKEYVEIQNKKLFNYFGKVFPDMYMEYKKIIQHLMVSNPRELYHICMGLDVYYFIKMFRTNTMKYITEPINNFLHEIETFVHDWIRTNIIKLNKHEPADSRYINQLVIEQFYAKELIKEIPENSQITVYNNLNNEPRYDLFSKEIPIRGLLKKTMTEKDIKKMNARLQDRLYDIAEKYRKEWTF